MTSQRSTIPPIRQLARTGRATAATAVLCGLAVGVLAQPASSGAGIDDLRNARDMLVRAADYAGALEPANAIVEAMEETSDPALGRELLSLARIQAGLHEFDEAEESYLHAIELITDIEGSNAPALIGAHQGLGRVYLNDRRFDEALVVLDEARAISRRLSGLFNIDQATIVDDLTLAHLGSGNTIDALDLQQERLDDAIRRFDADDPRLIPFHSHFGDYLDNSRLRVAAREQFARALELSDQRFGSDSAESLALLRRLAEIDLLLDEDNGIAERIGRLLAALPDLDSIQRAGALTTLGDWALVHQGADAAAVHYREAYRLLAEREQIDAAAYFRTPVPLNLIPPLSRVDQGTRRDPWSWGDLTLEFDVSADGRASNVRTAAMNPDNEDVAADYSRRIREAIFRPRIADGRLVSTADVRYQQSFRFYVRD